MTKITVWHGCYEGSLKGLVTRKSIKDHPAKMSRRLCERIFDHGIEMGYWKPGDVIVDPFAGIFTTGIIGAYRGFRVVGVELESKYEELARANLDLNRPKLNQLCCPLPVLIHGDSRKLRQHVAEALGAITSPPFAGNSGGTGPASADPLNKKYPGIFERHLGSMNNAAAYGATEGQINAMPTGDFQKVVGGITSPPFTGREQSTGGTPDSLAHHTDGRSAPRKLDGLLHGDGYGTEAGQIGSMKHGDFQKVVGGITSPPYEETDIAGKSGNRSYGDDYKRTGKSPRALGQMVNERYGDTPGQIGREKGATYWQAVADVYAETFALLPIGGTLAVVVKNFVKNGKRVPLCDQTCQLLEALGFTVVERCRAMQIKERHSIDLFGQDQTKLIQRKSYFRLNAEKKGAPKIDWEEVVWAMKIA